MGTVSYNAGNLPPVSQEDLDRVAAIKDDNIDYSDTPNLAGLKLRPRPMAEDQALRTIFAPRDWSLSERFS